MRSPSATVSLSRLIKGVNLALGRRLGGRLYSANRRSATPPSLLAGSVLNTSNIVSANRRSVHACGEIKPAWLYHGSAFPLRQTGRPSSPTLAPRGVRGPSRWLLRDPASAWVCKRSTRKPLIRHGLDPEVWPVRGRPVHPAEASATRVSSDRHAMRKMITSKILYRTCPPRRCDQEQIGIMASRRDPVVGVVNSSRQALFGGCMHALLALTGELRHL